ncbi:uncharacterized protein LOC130048656 [Ostrea edulis]|uniref:uncharacterized protein LOC130048656 n=1 Tax=Ostrea edulis TaxID=37623 RepID=UPI0024AEDDB7|nr:uncharacterized protein LOC130048656 [Ostrea edulis]
MRPALKTCFVVNYIAIMEYKMKVDEPSLSMDNYHLILEPCWELVCKVFDNYLDTHMDCPINLADFGTCEGQTFLPFLKLVVGHIRRSSKLQEIVVTLNDQYTNDFNALTRNIKAFQREMDDPLLRMCIIPGNAYRHCLPNSSIDLGICSFVVQWLSEPINLDKHLFYIPDWMDFLIARSMEMKKGSFFLANIPIGSQEVLSILNDVFHQLYEKNTITEEDLRNTSIPIYIFRTEDELKGPFEERREELGLQLLHISRRPVKLYEHKGIVSSLKSWMYYSFETGLSKTRRTQEVQEICDTYFQNLEHRFSDWKWLDVFIADVLFQKL